MCGFMVIFTQSTSRLSRLKIDVPEHVPNQGMFPLNKDGKNIEIRIKSKCFIPGIGFAYFQLSFM